MQNTALTASLQKTYSCEVSRVKVATVLLALLLRLKIFMLHDLKDVSLLLVLLLSFCYLDHRNWSRMLASLCRHPPAINIANLLFDDRHFRRVPFCPLLYFVGEAGTAFVRVLRDCSAKTSSVHLLLQFPIAQFLYRLLHLFD